MRALRLCICTCAFLLCLFFAVPSFAQQPLSSNQQTGTPPAAGVIEGYGSNTFFMRHLELTVGKEIDIRPRLPQKMYAQYRSADALPEESSQITQEFPVIWEIPEIDFSKTGSYTITGTLDDTGCSVPLDWTNAPELKITVELLPPRKDILMLECLDRALQEGNTARLSAIQGNKEIPLDSFTGIKLWCSLDNGRNWTNWFNREQVQFSQDVISISGLEIEQLLGDGYLFQLETGENEDFEALSYWVQLYLYEEDDKSLTLFFSQMTGGDRGGGNREDNPPPETILPPAAIAPPSSDDDSEEVIPPQETHDPKTQIEEKQLGEGSSSVPPGHGTEKQEGYEKPVDTKLSALVHAPVQIENDKGSSAPVVAQQQAQDAPVTQTEFPYGLIFAASLLTIGGIAGVLAMKRGRTR